MRELILHALAGAGDDYVEVRVERRRRTEITCRNGALENVDASETSGAMVRCLAGGGWGIAVASDLRRLDAKVAEARATARAVASRVRDRAELAPVAPVQDDVRASFVVDPRAVSLAEKQKLVVAYDGVLKKAGRRVAETAVAYTDTLAEITFANSEGAYIVEERPDLTLLLAAVGRGDAGLVQRAFESRGWAAGFEKARDREASAEAVARRADALLDAKPVTGGVYTVVADPILTGVFVHEAFGHLCEADFLVKNPNLLEILKPGRRFGREGLDVVDDGERPGVRGAAVYDDEGVRRRKVFLVKDGVMQGYLHNRETAARMGVAPTGNARAVSWRFEPIVRMRDTYVGAGSASFEEMLAGVERGIYACGSFGGQTELEQFTFSTAYAYEIVNGRVGDMLREVVISGNVFETLNNIDLVGRDLEAEGSSGGCGKSGQDMLGVTTGGPHVRFRNAVVGGRK